MSIYIDTKNNMYNLMSILYEEQNGNSVKINKRRHGFDLGSRPLQQPIVNLSTPWEHNKPIKTCVLQRLFFSIRI